MAKIRATWYQNGDMHKSVKIKRNIKLYHAKSYVMRVFLFNRTFNSNVYFSGNRLKIPEFDTLIMSSYVTLVQSRNSA